MALVVGARLVAVLALGFGAAAFFAGAAFFTLEGAAFALVAALGLAVFGFGSLAAFSFCRLGQCVVGQARVENKPLGRQASSRQTWTPSSSASRDQRDLGRDGLVREGVSFGGR